MSLSVFIAAGMSVSFFYLTMSEIQPQCPLSNFLKGQCRLSQITPSTPLINYMWYRRGRRVRAQCQFKHFTTFPWDARTNSRTRIPATITWSSLHLSWSRYSRFMSPSKELFINFSGGGGQTTPWSKKKYVDPPLFLDDKIAWPPPPSGWEK